ncbi:MAG: PIN domain-containing protein [Verrucomicrobiae bacterium]|nr:PIN domain-containing protein [Verrucomicrobiae bacterium]
MRFAADSSFLVGLYLDPQAAGSSERFLTDDAKVISVSELARVEVLNVLLRDPDLGAAERFEEELREGVRIRLETVDWPDAFTQAESLARRFTRTLRPGGHDLMLVAAAVVMGATYFISLDRLSRQRSLAAAAGLKIWPPLDKEERGLARLARQ